MQSNIELEQQRKALSNLNKLIDEDNKTLLVALESLIELYKERNSSHYPKLPISIFADGKLSILEAVVKFLKENKSLSYSEIAKLLNRDARTVWTAYHSSIARCASFELAENVIFLVPVAKVLKSWGTIQKIKQYGGIVSIWLVPASRCGFPFGFPAGAFHFKRNYTGATQFTYAQDEKDDQERLI